MDTKKRLQKFGNPKYWISFFNRDRLANKLCNNYSFKGGYKRIYHYHVRKAGGTSLNFMFLSLGGEDGKSVYRKLTKAFDFRYIYKTKVFVAWNKIMLERQDYFYGFSHIPAHKINLPKDTFTITIIRDPVRRLLSHYRMLIEFKEKKSSHPGFLEEQGWLTGGFFGFAKRMPREHLLRQLYMFSSNYNVHEAFEKITNCGHFLITEEFKEGVKELNNKLGLTLKPIHVRKSNKKEQQKIETSEVEEILKPEIELYEKLKKYRAGEKT